MFGVSVGTNVYCQGYCNYHICSADQTCVLQGYFDLLTSNLDTMTFILKILFGSLTATAS